MHRRYQDLNVPTEILRSVVGVSDAGSITKAAASLGLSQPAMSSQIRRLENLVGGSVFQRTANGSVATDLGKIVLRQARKVLEANDQLLRLRGSSQIERAVRLGLSNLYAQTVFRGRSKGTLGNVSVYCGNSTEIAKGLLDGFGCRRRVGRN